MSIIGKFLSIIGKIGKQNRAVLGNAKRLTGLKRMRKINLP